VSAHCFPRQFLALFWVSLPVDPHAYKLTVHILAAVAQHEREMISERTRLPSSQLAQKQSAKKRGAKFDKTARHTTSKN